MDLKIPILSSVYNLLLYLIILVLKLSQIWPVGVPLTYIVSKLPAAL